MLSDHLWWLASHFAAVAVVGKVAELAVQFYVTNDNPNVSGLVLAGSADFKTELSQSDMFDQRLQAVVLGVVDVSYGEGGSKRLMRERYWHLESWAACAADLDSCLVLNAAVCFGVNSLHVLFGCAEMYCRT